MTGNDQQPRSIVDRVKNILLQPAREWEVIEGEAETIGGLYRRYIIPLAAIPAVAGLIGQAVEECPEGGVLVFLPGEGEIRRVESALRLGQAYAWELIRLANGPVQLAWYVAGLATAAIASR